MVSAPHQWSRKLGSRGNTHQDDGDDGQHDVDALPQQDSGIMALKLDCLLLLLLLELQLGHSCLTRLEGFLRHMKTEFVCTDCFPSGCRANCWPFNLQFPQRMNYASAERCEGREEYVWTFICLMKGTITHRKEMYTSTEYGNGLITWPLLTDSRQAFAMCWHCTVDPRKSIFLWSNLNYTHVSHVACKSSLTA